MIPGQPMDVFDKNGQPIATREEFYRLKADESYVRIGGDYIGDYWVSTAWLGYNYRFWGNGPPIIFETMVFGPGGILDEYQERYTTEEAAREGHQRTINAVRAEVDDNG